MKKAHEIRILILTLSVFTLASSAHSASLLEVYQQALQGDPQIHEAEARRLASLEAKPQARGVLMPQIQATGNWDNTNTSGLRFIERTFDQDSNNTNWGVSLRQSLFRWDQIINLRRADKIVAKAEAVREAAQQNLIIRVAQRYFEVLAAEDKLMSRQANGEAIARQLEQAKKRFDVGLIAITDVQESQAAYDQSIADIIDAKRTLANAREFMREITGQYITKLNAPGEDFPLLNPVPNNEENWINLSLGQNLNLVASRLDEKLAREEISFRRNGHYPSLDLVVSTSESTSEGDFIVTSGNTTNIFDDTNTRDQISLQLTVPLFSGGYNSSRVKEAVYLHRASREQLQRITRETERQARDAYLGVNAEMSRVKAFDRAVTSSQTALQATQAGYEVGTRTIIEVLNSQFSMHAAITNFYQSRYNYIMNVLRLKQSAGILQVQDLELIDKWLRDRASPEEAQAQKLKKLF
jgi:outer membrane protein